LTELPAMVSVKTQLYIGFKASGMTKTELGRKLGIPKTNVDRLFNFKNQTRFHQVTCGGK
jgi:hypothetical protein